MAQVIDAHHHFWDPSRAEYPWMTDEVAAIRRRFGPDDLRPLLDANAVDYTILVQARSSVDETAEFLASAEVTDFVAGVVGWVDLTAADVTEVLGRLREGVGGRYLVGVRHQVHDEEDPEWLLRPDVRRGLGALAEAGLVYDLLVRPRELPAAATVAREHPDLRFVVDHIAKPAMADGHDQGWTTGMAALADLGNVYCKVSGMVTELDWSTWGAEQLVPFVQNVRDWFGDERLLFGSDWPVCLLAAGYGEVLEALRYALGDVSAEARAAILGGNAARLYNLPIAGSRAT